MKQAVQKSVRVKEAALFLGVGVSTVWAYRKRGLITAYKLSDKVTVFKLEELEAFLESCKVEVS